MGSRRECTRILGLEGVRVEQIEWEGDGPRARACVCGWTDEASVAMNAPAVDDGPGAFVIAKSGRGTICLGPNTM